jgi:hypothetical protein
MSLKEFIGYAAGAVPAPPLAYPIEDAPAVTGIPRTKIFEAIRTKQLMVRKAGRTTIVEHPELLRYVTSLPCKGREVDAERAEA